MTWTNLPGGEVNFYNQRWYNYTGLDYKKTKEWGWKAIVHPEDLPATMDAYTDALQTGNNFVIENRYKKADGTYRWHLNRALPIKNETGEIILWVGTATDIHEQKEVEENLERLVKERTIQLERSNEDLQQFAHVASHDLREPVRKIKIFTSRLQEEMNTDLNGKSKLYLNKVQSAADRMFNMIDGVLTYSSMNAYEQIHGTIELTEVLKNIEADLEITIQQKEAKIIYSNFPAFEGAPVLIYQLFYNLINNSLKFAKAHSSLVISITSQEIEYQNKKFIQIIVSDNGIGFEQKFAEKIFDTFVRLNVKDKYEGTGLGLALCKKIVQRHHGTITANGEIDHGARFIIKLPLRQKKNTD